MSSTQDEAFKKWWKQYPTERTFVRRGFCAGWDASHKLDEELLAAYRELDVAHQSLISWGYLDSEDPTVKPGDEELCIAAIHKARAKIVELEAR